MLPWSELFHPVSDCTWSHCHWPALTSRSASRGRAGLGGEGLRPQSRSEVRLTEGASEVEEVGVWGGREAKTGALRPAKVAVVCWGMYRVWSAFVRCDSGGGCREIAKVRMRSSSLPYLLADAMPIARTTRAGITPAAGASWRRTTSNSKRGGAWRSGLDGGHDFLRCFAPTCTSNRSEMAAVVRGASICSSFRMIDTVGLEVSRESRGCDRGSTLRASSRPPSYAPQPSSPLTSRFTIRLCLCTTQSASVAML